MRAWLQLVRLPAVFTALADICLGFLLNNVAFGSAPDKFALLLVASASLYMAGMAFNDVFDRDIDARERPSRPIPSGRIPVRSAAVFATGLMLAGLLAAGLAGLQSLLVAAGLAAAVLAYDAFLKRTPLGPLGMGACRFLNVMLGASAPTGTGIALAAWSRYQWMPAAALALYIVGVTWFARQEAGRSSRWGLAGATVVIAMGLGAVLWVGGNLWIGDQQQAVMITLGVMTVILIRRLMVTVARPEPERVQSAVKGLLMSYVLLDATLIFAKTGETGPAIATALLLVPAMFLGRWLYVT